MIKETALGRKRKPGDSPLTRGMCVGIAISMNTSLHVSSALIHCKFCLKAIFKKTNCSVQS